MRLRSQFIALIAASGAICALVVSGVLLATVLPAFERAEWEEARADGRRLFQALAVESAALGTHARDYAVWDDVYAYLDDRDPNFIETGITPDSTLPNLSLDLMQIRDIANVEVWSAGEVGLEPDEVGPFLGQPGDGPRIAVVSTAQGPLLLAAHPVVTSAGAGPSRGWMIMGRLLDEDWLAAFGRRVDLRVALIELGEPFGPDPFKVEVLDEDNLAVHAALRDADGGAALLVRATLPRNIRAQGRHAALLAGWMALASLLLVAPLMMFLLERRVTGPISRLTRFIERLAPGGPGGQDRKADEVELLEHTFHDLMRRLGDTEARLRETAERAEDASRAKSLFLATMSHEIRTPLNGVVAAAELLDSGEQDEARRQLTGIIRTSAAVLQGTIEEVLDFSKIEAGRIELNPAPFSLVQVLEEASEVLAVRAAEKGLTLVSEVAEGMPDFFQGDAGRLRQILVNLGGNALKFTERGHVALRARPEGEDIRFEVEDSGIGIPADKQASIFDPFVQADNSTSRRYGGTGLGLSICRALVECMGGAIGLDSAPGRGSTLWFTVPLGTLPDRRRWPPVDLAGAAILVNAPAPLDQALCRLLRQLGARPGTDPAGGPWAVVVSTTAVAG
ncbi:MAG: hypothetical protein HQL41_18185, partial [Alphaproteobacteria bacterium]|nr:hypothetical protein [Alphaproteobacteria bacterium]